MEEYIYFFNLFLSKWWANSGVASLHVISVNVQVLFMGHLWATNTKLPFEFSQAPGWCQPRSVRWGRQGLGLPPSAKHKQTAHPDSPVPSGSMLRTALWPGASVSQYRIAVQVFCTPFFSDVVSFFCTNPARRTLANAGSVTEVPLFCDSCTA